MKKNNSPGRKWPANVPGQRRYVSKLTLPPRRTASGTPHAVCRPPWHAAYCEEYVQPDLPGRSDPATWRRAEVKKNSNVFSGNRGRSSRMQFSERPPRGRKDDRRRLLCLVGAVKLSLTPHASYSDSKLRNWLRAISWPGPGSCSMFRRSVEK